MNSVKRLFRLSPTNYKTRHHRCQLQRWYPTTMEKDETIHITWCHSGEVDALFAHSMMTIIQKMPERIGSFNNIQGLGLLSKSRNIAIKHFLDNTEDDWVFLVDADEYIGLPEFKTLIDAAERDERPFMSGLYFAANFTTPELLQAIPLIFIMTDNGVQPYFDYPRNEIVEIYAAGTGAMLIHRSVLEYMREYGAETFGEDWCWFQDGPLEGNKWLSEDLTFCGRLQHLGIPMYAHTGAIFPHHKRFWLMESHFLNSNPLRDKDADGQVSKGF